MSDLPIKVVVSSPSDPTYPSDLTMVELLALLGSAPTPANSFAALPVTGTDQAGNDLTFTAGASTGSGTPGRVVFQVSGAGSSGSSQNSAGDVLTLAGPAGVMADGLTITGGDGGVTLAATGSSTDVGLTIESKGGGDLTLLPGGGLVVMGGTASFDLDADASFLVAVDGTGGLGVTGTEVYAGAGSSIGWTSSEVVGSGSVDTSFVRGSQGTIETRTTASGATYAGLVCGQKSASAIGLSVRRFSAGATGDLQTWDDETGAKLARVLPSGVVLAKGFASSGVDGAASLGDLVSVIPIYGKTGSNLVGYMPVYQSYS